MRCSYSCRFEQKKRSNRKPDIINVSNPVVIGIMDGGSACRFCPGFNPVDSVVASGGGVLCLESPECRRASGCVDD